MPVPKPQFVIPGILPALLTPFKDGDVNVDMLKKLVRFQLDQGCHGFFVNGSTGDGFLMTREERKRVVEVVVGEVAGQGKVIAHAGAMSSDESAAIAVDARNAGADAVASLPPIYYPVGIEGFELHMRTIGEAADMPTYCYYIPDLTGHALSGDQFVEIVQRIPNLVGFKYTHKDMFLLWWILDAFGGAISVFNGVDQMLLQGLTTGACGGIGSTYNYQARTIVDIYDAMQAGYLEKAQQAQWHANKVVQVLYRFMGGGVSVERAILRLMGFEVGPPRAPKVPFPEEKMPALRKALEEIGFLS